MNNTKQPHQPTGYDHGLDDVRLAKQATKVWNVMKGGMWRTLSEISALTGAPEASASAQLRDFRKSKCGNNFVFKRRRGDHTKGWYEYKLVTNKLVNVIPLDDGLVISK